MKEPPNFLSVEDFEKFYNTIPNIDRVWSGRRYSKPYTKFPSEDMLALFKILYGCALRITEAVNLELDDFDLKNRLLKIRSQNEETTILPTDIEFFDRYLSGKNKGKLFKFSRHTAWQYTKIIGEKANLKIFKKTKVREMEGVKLDIFRYSQKRNMQKLGADPELINLKLRLRSEINYGGYTIDNLKDWERKQYKEFLTKNEIRDYVEWYKEKRSLYEELASEVRRILEINLKLKNITYHHIDSRAKLIESFENKLRAGINFRPKEMQDLVGIRIICYVKSDVEKISALVENLFEIDYHRSYDKAKILGEDRMGYSSIHYIAKLTKSRLEADEMKRFSNLEFEIQIRTILQHAWAEIEHDEMYKNKESLPLELRRRLYLVSTVLESADNEFESIHMEREKQSKKLN